MSTSTVPPRNSAKTQRAVAAGRTMQVKSTDDLLDQLAQSWERGERHPAEYFLNRNPQVLNEPAAAAELVYEEFCIREELGETVTPEQYYERFVELQDELENLFDRHEPVEPHQPATAFPAVGEQLGEFRLLAVLGEGALGRVYLASQPLLGDRRVVLKVTRQRCDEHLSLSRLQHTHIVPLYGVLEDRQRKLSAFCMPFFGGATLEQILKRLSPSVEQRSGSEILAALHQVGEKTDRPALLEGGSCEFLKNASYSRALTWIFACLSEALAYMHQRGLLHLDLKPSNILVAGDGQPMLIDFHLAHESLKAGSTAVGDLGGTFYYMSPEQKRAVDAVIRGEPIPTDVDRRSDIYGLGLVLYQALSGRRPNVGEAEREPLTKLNPNVSPGLSDIVDRCLAADPSDRYDDAASLAGDLRRHLANLPLRVAGNRSLAERWQKWRRRRPFGPALLAMLLLLIFGAAGTCLFGWLHVQERISLAHSRLEVASRLDAAGNHDEALRALQEALQKTERLPGTASVRERLSNQRDIVRQHKLARRLGDSVDRLRMLEGFDERSQPQLEALYSSCFEVWRQRDQLYATGSDFESGGRSRSMRTDLLDLGVLLAGFRGRLSNDVAGHRQALAILADTEAMFGTSTALEVQRSYHADAAGLTEQAKAAERRATKLFPGTAWEHHALARWLLGRGELAKASEHFESAIRLEPDSFWPHYYRAECAQRLKDYQTAVSESSVCIALSPERAESYYHRALALAALGQRLKAAEDIDRALQLAPDLAPAIRLRAALQDADAVGTRL